MEQKRWNLSQVQKHIQLNSKETYSMAIVLSALYKRQYGSLPKIGLSGAQADYAELVFKKLP